MSFKIRYVLKFILIFLIVFSFSLPVAHEVQAAKKKTTSASIKKSTKKKKKRVRRRRSRRRRRSYNPERTIRTAITLIRTTSENVSLLAGLEPATDSTSAANLKLEEYVLSEQPTGEELAGSVDKNASADLDQFKTLWLDFVDDGEGDDFTPGGLVKQDIMKSVMKWLGTPYRFGGTSTRNIDCSAFIRQVFREVCEVNLPRTARAQYHVGEAILQKSNLEFGDLIFFHTYSRRYPSHVGIFLGDNLFAHASSTNGVTVSTFKGYYIRRFIGGKRLDLDGLTKYSMKKKTSNKH